jgi:hypothetical protein
MKKKATFFVVHESKTREFALEETIRQTLEWLQLIIYLPALHGHTYPSETHVDALGIADSSDTDHVFCKAVVLL